MTRIPPVRRLLIDARKLIRKPENWTKGAFARTKAGTSVPTHHSFARQFCVSGALQNAAGPGLYDEYSAARKLVGDCMPEEGHLLNFNDALSTTHPMVMKLFNQAIRRAKEQGI